jgi:3-oxoacyl-[acyl-carrier-protein] synthase-3
MRWDDVYLRACATWLPPVLTAEDAVARGLADATAVRRMQVTGVTTTTEAPAAMAAAAARTALTRAGCTPEEVGLILHASIYHQGHDFWSASSYVQRAAVGNRCPAMEIRQSSNGGMAALEVAAAYLAAGMAKTALITTADRFCEPGVDRWRSDPGTVLADGGTALVVGRGYGFARLRSLVLVSDPTLEQMHRGADEPGAVPFAARQPIDISVTTRSFLSGDEGRDAFTRMERGCAESIDQALDEASVTFAGIDRFVLPNLGRRRLDVHYFRRYGIDPARSTWDWGRGVGHLGAGDQFAALAVLVERGQLRPGQICLLAGIGGGFTWSAATVEILDVPRWREDEASIAVRADL